MSIRSGLNICVALSLAALVTGCDAPMPTQGHAGPDRRMLRLQFEQVDAITSTLPASAHDADNVLRYTDAGDNLLLLGQHTTKQRMKTASSTG